jgi:hypothetical protein
MFITPTEGKGEPRRGRGDNVYCCRAWGVLSLIELTPTLGSLTLNVGGIQVCKLYVTLVSVDY